MTDSHHCAMRTGSLTSKVFAKFHSKSGFTTRDIATACGITLRQANVAVQALIHAERFKRITAGLYRATGAV